MNNSGFSAYHFFMAFLEDVVIVQPNVMGAPKNPLHPRP
jgi:hypothetical protein